MPQSDFSHRAGGVCRARFNAGGSEATVPAGAAAPPRRRIIASVHDVTPRFENAIDLHVERLTARLGASKLAMLVVPDFWGESPLTRAPQFRAKLRRWAEQGIEMFLHGFNHRDDSTHRSLLSSVKARVMTAREGEFLGLSSVEADRRLAEGRSILEDAIGQPVAGFVAPAWLYGPGAIAALRAQRFSIAEDHWRIWRPCDGATLARAPVVTWASRSRGRILSSLAFAKIAPSLLAPFATVRLAVHPGDAAVPALVRSIEQTLETFLATRTPASYRELAAVGAP